VDFCDYKLKEMHPHPPYLGVIDKHERAYKSQRLTFHINFMNHVTKVHITRKSKFSVSKININDKQSRLN